MRDEDPSASSSLLLDLAAAVGARVRVGEDGDATGAGAGGEEGRVVVDGLDQGDDRSVEKAFGGLVWQQGGDGG